MNEVERRARSLILNKDRAWYLSCIAKGLKVPGLKDVGGWLRVSFHVSGMNAAWVQQNKIRKMYPQLTTKVVNVSDKPCDWAAEIWVKLKEEQ